MKMDEQDIQDLLNPTKKLTKKRRQEVVNEFVSSVYRYELEEAVLGNDKQAIRCYRKALLSAIDALGADEETYWTLADTFDKKATKRHIRASGMHNY